MDEFSQRYAQTLFERDYPAPPPEPVESKPAAAPTKGSGERAQHPAMTPEDVGLTIMDTFAGLAKGAVAQSIGVGGDIRTLVDMVAEEPAKKIMGERMLPTTEEMQRLLPQLFPDGVQVDPRRRATAAASEKAGEFLPIAPITAVKNAARVIKYGADGKRVPIASGAAATASGSTDKGSK
jgi:hypothetical protein